MKLKMSDDSINLFYDECKNRWEPGEWCNKPHFYHEFYRDFNLFFRKNTLGVWTGYVEVPNHIGIEDEWLDDLYVHGGITFNDSYNPTMYENAANCRYIGFDCGHYMDYVPASENHMATIEFIEEFPEDFKKRLGDAREEIKRLTTYKTLDFCIEQAHGIVDQIMKKFHSDAQGLINYRQ